MESVEGGTVGEPSTGVPLVAATVIPPGMKSLGEVSSSSPELPRQNTNYLQVPPGLLYMSEVVRPRAYLRRGPGTHFEVGDQILPKGTAVMIHAEVGVWRKVQILKEGRVGWIHHRALSEPHSNRQMVRIDSKNLPTVSTVKALTSVESFPDHDRVPLIVPKGSVFHLLRSNHEGFLVLMPSTNSVLWLTRKDAQ